MAAVTALATAALLAVFVFGGPLSTGMMSMLGTIQAARLLPAGITVGVLLVLVSMLWTLRAVRKLQASAVWPVWLTSLILFGFAQFGVAYLPLSGAVLTQRNFYGVLHVKEEREDETDIPILSLYHGRILRPRRNHPI